MDGKKIKLQIWDTAGQERFRTITTAYYRGAMGIMLVYDITNEKSFDNIKNWIRNIEEHASADVEKMILGNKCDMNDRRQVRSHHTCMCILFKMQAECHLKCQPFFTYTDVIYEFCKSVVL